MQPVKAWREIFLKALATIGHPTGRGMSLLPANSVVLLRPGGPTSVARDLQSLAGGTTFLTLFSFRLEGGRTMRKRRAHSRAGPLSVSMLPTSKLATCCTWPDGPVVYYHGAL